MSEIILSKYLCRERSLFYAHMWNEVNRLHFTRYTPKTNIKNIFYHRNKLGVIEAYYDLKELDASVDKMVANIINNSEVLDQIIKDFLKNIVKKKEEKE